MTAPPLPMSEPLPEPFNDRYPIAWGYDTPCSLPMPYLFTADQMRARDAMWAKRLAAERERCAELCEGNQILSGGNGPNFSFGWRMAIQSCATAIRAIAKEPR